MSPGLPSASVTGTVQHAGMKRHADEGGQRHRVGKGRTGMQINVIVNVVEIIRGKTIQA